MYVVVIWLHQPLATVWRYTSLVAPMLKWEVCACLHLVLPQWQTLFEETSVQQIFNRLLRQRTMKLSTGGATFSKSRLGKQGKRLFWSLLTYLGVTQCHCSGVCCF